MSAPSINRAWIVGDADVDAFVKAFGLRFVTPRTSPDAYKPASYMAEAYSIVIRDKKER